MDLIAHQTAASIEITIIATALVGGHERTEQRVLVETSIGHVQVELSSIGFHTILIGVERGQQRITVAHKIGVNVEAVRTTVALVRREVERSIWNDAQIGCHIWCSPLISGGNELKDDEQTLANGKH